MYKLAVAIRYLRRNRLNLIGVVAVAIGVLGLFSVLSVMKGFDEEFRARIRGTLSDLIIEDWRGGTFGEYEAMMAKIESFPHVKACAPLFEGLGLITIKFMEGTRSDYTSFRGIDIAREVKTTQLAEYCQSWRGKEAREKLADMLLRPGMTSPDFDTVHPLLVNLRHEDFAFLDKGQQSLLRALAESNKFDLDAAFRAAESAMPQWMPAEEPNSPVLMGYELLVVATDTEGRPITMPVGYPTGTDGRVSLITATGAFEESRTVRRCVISGGFHSGLSDYDSQTVYLPLADAQRFMSKPGQVTCINVRLDSFANAPLVRAHVLGILTPEELAQGLGLIRSELERTDPRALRLLDKEVKVLLANADAWFSAGDPTVIRLSHEIGSVLASTMGDLLKNSPTLARRDQAQKFHDMAIARDKGGIGFDKFRVRTWEDKRRVFLRAIGLERRVLAFILFFLVLIAGLLILSNMLTTVVSKTRDIGTLKALGGSTRGIMTIFLTYGLLIGIVGSILGAVTGMALTSHINEIEAFLHRMLGFSLFPHEIYYLDRIPVDQHPWPSILMICCTAVIVSLLAAAYPAWKAARMDAVEALRYE